MNVNTPIRLISIIPFMMSSISFFVSLLVLLNLTRTRPHMSRKVIIYASIMFFVIGCFFLSRGYIFSVLSISKNNTQLILDMDRLVRSSPFILFVSVMVFTVEYFTSDHNKTATLFFIALAFFVFIITMTTSLVLDIPINRTGAYGIVRATDQNGIWSNIFAISAIAVIIHTILEILRHHRRISGKAMIIAYFSLVFGTLWDLLPLLMTRSTDQTILWFPGMEVGALIFTVIVCFILLQDELSIEHRL